MRWREPSFGETKIKSWFALFPVTLRGETRWLEKVTVLYQYDHIFQKTFVPQCFIDEEEVT